MNATRRPRVLPSLAIVLGALALTVTAFGLWRAWEGGSAVSQSQGSRTVVVVGDSNTEADSRDFGAGRIGESSWVHWLLAEPGLEFAGGWALAGSTSADQAIAVSAMPDFDAPDELLVMTGTNDLTVSLEFEVAERSLDLIVDKVGASHVTILAIPPRDDVLAVAAIEFNARLAALAADRGWGFFDGFAEVRLPSGGFVAGATTDGIHLARDVAERFGADVARQLRAQQSSRLDAPPAVG